MLPPIARALAALALLLAVPAAASASAREQLIAAGPVEGLQAAGGWVSWFESGRQMMWHDGRSTVFDGPFVRTLGTDADGDGVGLLVRCGDARCTVRDRLLTDGPTSERFTTAPTLRSVDEHRGSFLLGFRGRGHPRGIYIRRRGEDSLRRLSRLRPGDLSISSRVMTSFWPDVGLFAASRNRPHRWRLIARASDPDFIRGAYGGVLVFDAQAHGRYAYWLETRIENHENGETAVFTRILRVDPRPSHRHVEVFQPRAPHDFGSLAVTDGNVFFTDGRTGPLYEVRHPTFYRSGDPIPVAVR